MRSIRQARLFVEGHSAAFLAASVGVAMGAFTAALSGYQALAPACTGHVSPDGILVRDPSCVVPVQIWQPELAVPIGLAVAVMVAWLLLTVIRYLPRMQ